jgi:uncharacterized membrane protein HdeD (DUF308 family)
MLRWPLRIAAVALILAGLWLLSEPRYASTEAGAGDIRGWVLIVLGAIYFIAEHRLKLRADQRAERAEAREVEFHRRRMDDKE